MLPLAHLQALGRQRRILIQNDAAEPQTMLGMDIRAWLAYHFDYLDEPGHQVDTVFWDVGEGNYAVYPSRVCLPTPSPALRRWLDAGSDWVRILVEESHKRGLEAFWNHRISEVEYLSQKGLEMTELFPAKAEHPDWVVKTWWWQGMWNLAAPGLREYKVRILRELAENYEFDGFQIDFSRHVPCLPVGRQWELREHVTTFMRGVRTMLLDVAGARGRPILLSAKVPETLEGCRADGFDVETWALEHLVDLFSLGSRCMTVDVEAFRRITQGTPIRLYPCHDDHHATDGYKFPPLEVFRGIFGNWLQQGADGVETFNWSCARLEVREKLGNGLAGPASHRQAYHECGTPETMNGKDKIFAVERRGGYPWAEGYFNQNLTAPLPAALAYDGQPTVLTIRNCDDLTQAHVAVTLRIILFAAVEGDQLGVEFNGTSLAHGRYDFAWKDGQIFSPRPQPPSGRDDYPIDPEQKLLRLEHAVAPAWCRVGQNHVSIRVISQAPHCVREIHVEKVELHLNYTAPAGPVGPGVTP
jgi:hypothetical protein